MSTWLAVRANQARALAERREVEARENLYTSYLKAAAPAGLAANPASALVHVEAAAKAAAIRPSVELRSEAASALALVDVRTAREWNGAPPIPSKSS